MISALFFSVASAALSGPTDGTGSLLVFPGQEHHVVTPEALRKAAEIEAAYKEDTEEEYKSLNTMLSPVQRLEAMQAQIAERLIGQPEVIDALIDIERKKRVLGLNHRLIPEVLYLMGQPGVGKDTAVESYARAIHGPANFDKHIFRLPVAKDSSELWKAFGAKPGYIGSKDLSEFVKFLVRHSGGRYKIMYSEDEKRSYVEESPYWKPIRPIPKGGAAPEDTIVFVDEFHNWSSEAKDEFFKLAFETGRFPINNPGSGISEICVPVTFIIASNEGIDKITARNIHGEKIGKSLSFDQIMDKWERVHLEKNELIKVMTSQRLKTSNSRNPGGISEELANRIPKDRILLMRPLPKGALPKIAQLRFADGAAEYETAAGEFGRIKITANDAVFDFLGTYKFDAEEGARGVRARVRWLDDVVLKWIYANADHNQRDHQLFLDVVQQKDGSYDLKIKYKARDVAEQFASLPIAFTKSQHVRERMSPADVAKLGKLSANMQEKLAGLAPVTDRLQNAVMVSEEQAHRLRFSEDEGAAARVFLFLGLSSTGKTQTAKVLASMLPGGSEERLKMMDFGSVKTYADLRDKIFGSRDEYGRPVKSEFMEHYDKYDGKIVIVMDEIANAPRELLKALYDMFREGLVTGFSDGKPRSMRNVIMIGTGNAGEEWYSEIPRQTPKMMQMFAMREIYDQAMEDPGYRRMILERYFSEALLNRIGEGNVFFYPPLGFQQIREISIAKLNQVMASFPQSDTGWGWDIKFGSQSDYVKFLDMVDLDGFVVREQGASIDRFVLQDFGFNLRARLMNMGVPSGTAINIRFKDRRFDKRTARHINSWQLDIAGWSQAEVFEMLGAQEQKQLAPSEESQIVTAYHEAGHELVAKVLLGDQIESKRISIIPGVTKIGDAFVNYLGIAQHEMTAYLDPTRTKAIADIAVLMAGEVAEDMVTGQHTGGKANDIKMAMRTAQIAIIEYGLSTRWGNFSRGDRSLVDFIAGLSEARQTLLEQEVQRMIEEGRDLAKRVIEANFDTHFVPLALQLAELGELDGEKIQAIYDQTPVTEPVHTTKHWLAEKESVAKPIDNLGAELFTAAQVPANSLRVKLLPHIPRPKSVANIAGIIEARRAQEIARVKLTMGLVRVVEASENCESSLLN